MLHAPQPHSQSTALNLLFTVSLNDSLQFGLRLGIGLRVEVELGFGKLTVIDEAGFNENSLEEVV